MNLMDLRQAVVDACTFQQTTFMAKSVLEPVPEIQWLGKWLVLSGGGAGVFPKGQGGGLLYLVSGFGLRCCPYTQTRPSYPGTFYLEPAPSGWVRPFFKWLVGPLSVGAKLASKLPPILGPEPPALPLAFL